MLFLYLMETFGESLDWRLARLVRALGERKHETKDILILMYRVVSSERRVGQSASWPAVSRRARDSRARKSPRAQQLHERVVKA